MVGDILTVRPAMVSANGSESILVRKRLFSGQKQPETHKRAHHEI